MDKLIENIINQANAFLNDAGEFYPFGAKLMVNGDVIPVGVYTDNYTDSQELIKILEKAALEEFKNGNVVGYAIGIDVRVDGEDALMIKFTNDGKEWDQKIYKYKI